jgi:dUTP pyrophosphatase
MRKIRGFEIISKHQYLIDILRTPENNEFENIKLPQRATIYSSGYDFFSPINFRLQSNGEITIPTGIKAYMLPDEELLLFPRSSIGFKFKIKIDNTIGKIDCDYYNNNNNEGHIFVKFTNTGNKVWQVNQGDAIIQGTFYKYLIADNDQSIKEVRTGGIGSTNMFD